MKTRVLNRAAAFSLIEVLIGVSIGTMALAAVVSGSIAIQRCFVAAEDFATGKTDQARLVDYLALDLRRAHSVTIGNDGTTIMTVKIPDYYDAAGKPRDPTITNYVASYGDPAKPVTIVYRKVGSSIFRQENAKPAREIAANVQDFKPLLQDLGKVVKTEVTFAPRFQRNATDAARTATSVYNTTLLRNKRKDLAL